MTREEHLRELMAKAVALSQSWQQLAGSTDLSNPVALDQLAMQSAAIGQAMQIVTDRASEAAAALLEGD